MRKRSGQVHSRESSATLQLTVSLLYPFYINLFPKKVEYAILLQKSCLMEAEIFEIGRETLTDSWQKNCNRHCRKPGEKECSG